MQATDRTIRVFLLDDHDLVRRGLRDLVSSARDITVVGESNTARTAAEMILRLDVDVMVLDLHLQDGTGIAVCRQVKAVDRSVHGLLLTAAGDDEAALATILAGADGYATKFAPNADLIGAIRGIGAHRPLLDPELTERVAADFMSSVQARRTTLTKQDREILRHVVDGLTDAEIADRIDDDVASVGPRVAALIERIAGFPTGAGYPPDGPGAGRHRRPQS